LATARQTLSAEVHVPPVFSIQLYNEGDRHVLQLTGDVDIGTAPVLAGAAAALSADTRHLTLDLSAVEFIDSSGLRALLDVRSACQAAECEFGVVPGGQQVQKLLEMTGVAEILRFEDGGDWAGAGAAPGERPDASRA